ncbi:TetR/AcrR family transcriptional regulator [Lutimaribacter saemankumensis]|uniref:DNA-binding transcriptional regulator, AcrR family n=1 Tax=Lutimaribacter saemankumensis TaxID=490829 RepID=A0A1G8K2E5_9RHOB|nr:TetR/AcrR family transcriptional regulator [Lutimaribacter saemankumensis]SDI37569.1 DNA-binding transcriptional regulator, AcrR family [Lutimaribacter saemankumensis]
MNKPATIVPPSEPDQEWSIAVSPDDSARGRLVAAAAHLFCNRGFAATGVDAIVARAGTAKATMYKHFPSKDDLIAAVLKAEGEAWRKWFFGRLSLVDGPARIRILAVFDVLEDWFADPGFYGCPFINAVAEFETGDHAARAAADLHKEHLLTWLKAQLIEMDIADPNESARSIAVLIDGAIVAAQHAHDPSFAQTAKRLAQCHLDSISQSS